MNILIGNPFYLELFVVDEINNPKIDLVVEYKIYKSDTGLLIVQGNLNNIGEGFYTKEIIFSEIGQYRILYIPSQNYPKQSETIMVDKNWIADIELIKNIESGNWKIINNQMIFYKDDNTTEIMRFNLFDQNGVSASEDIFKRERV